MEESPQIQNTCTPGTLLGMLSGVLKGDWSRRPLRMLLTPVPETCTQTRLEETTFGFECFPSFLIISSQQHYTSKDSQIFFKNAIPFSDERKTLPMISRIPSNQNSTVCHRIRLWENLRHCSLRKERANVRG